MTVCEFTYKDLKTAIDPNFLRARDRIRQLRTRGTRYAGLRGMSLYFRTPSSEYDKNHIIWTQEIKLLDLPEALLMDDLTLREKVNLSMNGDVAVRCNCPAMLYWGYAYLVSQLDAGAPGKLYSVPPDDVEMPENRFPGIRNPSLRGSVCKHLGLVFEVFGAHWNSLERDLKSQGYG